MDKSMDQWEIVGNGATPQQQQQQFNQPGAFPMYHSPVPAPVMAQTPSPILPTPLPNAPVPQSPIPSAPTTEGFYPAVNPAFSPVLINQSAAFVNVGAFDPNMSASVMPHQFVPPQHVVNFTPFAVPENVAKDIFRKWRDERWFAPSDFQNLKEGQLFAFLVPYYEFTATAYSSYSGKVGYYQESQTVTTHHHYGNNPGRHNHNHHTSTTRTVRWQPAHGELTATYPSILVCASVVNEDERLLSSIGNWDTTKVQCSPSYQNQLGPSKDWNACYTQAHRKIESENRNRARSQLRKETAADEVDNLSVTTSISHLQYRLIYFPVYYYGYYYENKEYKFFINGQNGARTGERPYGLGAIGRGINTAVNFISGLFAPPPSASKENVDEWKKLQSSNSSLSNSSTSTTTMSNPEDGKKV